MAHVDSYTKSDVKKILKEHDRTAQSYKNYVDSNRTKLNWSYGKQLSADEKLSKLVDRCADIMNGKPMQSQTNVMSEWVVTYPESECVKSSYKHGKKIRHYHQPTDAQHCKKFFDIVYEFACDRYGKENIISADVHMDETTPQIHIAFIPEATSRKTGKKTVSSASLLTRKELKGFHIDLQACMVQEFGKNDYILNGRTKGNYTTDELKARDADAEALQKRERAIEGDEFLLRYREQAVKKREDDLKTLKDSLENERKEFEKQRELKNKALERKNSMLNAREKTLSEQEKLKEVEFQKREDALEAQKKAYQEKCKVLDELIEKAMFPQIESEKDAYMDSIEVRKTSRGLPVSAHADFYQQRVFPVVAEIDEVRKELEKDDGLSL